LFLPFVKGDQEGFKISLSIPLAFEGGIIRELFGEGIGRIEK